MNFYIAIILMSIGVFISSLNAWMSVKFYFSRKKENFTLIPFIGGFLIFIGSLFFDKWIWFFLLLPFFDIGCGLLLIGSLVEFVKKRT